MALRGSLADINISDLVALLHAGERSGELIIVGPDSHIRMRFHLGRILDIEGAGGAAPDPLRAASRWRDGEFEFRAGVDSEPPASEAPLHEEALRILREAAGVDGLGGGPAGPALLDLERCTVLATFAASHPGIRYVCTLSAHSMINAEAAVGAMDPPAVRHAATAVCAFLRAYQRSTVRRLIVDDEIGLAIACPLPEGDTLLVMGHHDAGSASLGAAVDHLLGELIASR